MKTIAKIWADKGCLFVETFNDEGIIEYHRFKADVIDYSNLLEMDEWKSWLKRELEKKEFKTW